MNKRVYRRSNAKITQLNLKRLEKGLSLKDIGETIGASQQAVSNWLSGKYAPKRKYVEKLAMALDVSPELICETYNIKENVKKSTHRRKREIANTFWGNIRKESGLTLNEITELLNIDKSPKTVGEYFTGQIMPNDHIIELICNIFDVEFDLGKKEFTKVYEDWQTSRKRVVVDTVNPSEPIVDKVVVVATPEVKATTDSVEKLIYGEVSYDEYNLIRSIIRDNSTTVEVPRLIYDKVDYDTFNKILEILGV